MSRKSPLAAILNFRSSPNSSNPWLNFKRIRQHLQLVERERERFTDAAAEWRLNHITPVYIRTGDTIIRSSSHHWDNINVHLLQNAQTLLLIVTSHPATHIRSTIWNTYRGKSVNQHYFLLTWSLIYNINWIHLNYFTLLFIFKLCSPNVRHFLYLHLCSNS
jgi:hypothetical protein